MFPGIFSLPHCVTHWVVRSSAHMILAIKDDKILALHEKRLNYIDVFILHTCMISIYLWLRHYLHCQAISTHDTDYSQYHGYWWSVVRQGATMCWNQNIAGQDTKANTIASDSVAVAPCVLVIDTWAGWPQICGGYVILLKPKWGAPWGSSNNKYDIWCEASMVRSSG